MGGPALAIQTEGLTKFYGADRGVEDLDLEVGVGEVFGFLGPNGAGKTTTIRLLLDLIRPTRGRASVLGLDTRRDTVELRSRVGYLPGDLRLFDHDTGREMCAYLGALRGGVDMVRLDELGRRLELDLDRPIRSLSKGNRQKVGIVQAFMHRPDLLVLDEPTSGLDPIMQREFHRLVDEAVDGGATVFLSSHVLSEVQAIAHRVGVIREGHVVAVEDVDALRSKGLRRMEVVFAAPVSAVSFSSVPGVQDVMIEGGTRLRCSVEGDVDPFVKALARHHVLLLTSEEADLEDVFLAYYAGGRHAA
jgi:ABC-2 type transport system ATP-binding protein